MNATLDAILKTVIYHDLFDFPLTAQEIRLTMPAAVPLEEVLAALDSPEARLLGSKNGFFFLNGREAIVRTRARRYDLAEPKFKRVRAFFRLARHLPYLRAVFVCNTLARSNARDESDIDIFAVAAPGRLWLTRLMVSGLATLLGMRRKGEHVKDQLCLSFFVDETALDLRPLAIEDDVYLAHWQAELFPVYDEAGITEIIGERNGWVRRRLPNAVLQRSSSRRFVQPALLGLKRACERLLDATAAARLERRAKRLQSSWIEEKWKHQAERSVGVVVSDSVLKFHERDRRAEFRDRYSAALRKLVIPNEEATTSVGIPFKAIPTAG
jgi:hypothetical protein